MVFALEKARDTIIRRSDKIKLSELIEILQTEDAMSNTYQICMYVCFVYVCVNAYLSEEKVNIYIGKVKIKVDK